MSRPYPYIPVGDCIEKISTCNPAATIKDAYFDYIDISSVDRSTKCVTGVTPTLGTKAPSRARQLVQSGDILVSTVRPGLNAVARVDDSHNNAIASTGFCILRPKHGVLDSRYLYYWVRSEAFINDMVARSTGANYPAVSDKTVKSALIPYPPFEDQVRIADTLDRADALRRKDQELLGKYDELAQSIFFDMFGDPLRNEKGWNVKKLGDVTKITSGGTPSRSNIEYYTDGTIPWVKTGDLKNRYVVHTEEHITELAINQSAAKKFPTGTVLVALYGATIGACSILKIDAATNQACGAILPSENLAEDFTYWYFISIKKHLISLGVGGAQPNISGQILKSLDIIVPPMNTQVEFCKRVNNIYKQRDNSILSLNATSSLFAGLSNKCFTTS